MFEGVDFDVGLVGKVILFLNINFNYFFQFFFFHGIGLILQCVVVVK